MRRKTGWGLVSIAVVLAGCGGEPPSGDGGTPEPGVRSSLVRLDDEPAGRNCTYGGTAIHTGVDVDSDGRLADDEISETSYVCNDLPGGNDTIVRVDEEPPGPNCENGGSAVHVGKDSDGNGQLSDGEISSTTFVCNGADTVLPEGALQGDYTIGNTLDIQLLQGYSSIDGDLTVSASTLSSFELPNLKSITGNLKISNCDALTSLEGFASLTSIGGRLDIQNNDSLVSLDGLGAVTSVGDDLAIGGNASLQSLHGLGALTSVGDDLSVAYNEQLSHVDGLDAVTSVGGGVTFYSNSSLAKLDGLGAVSSVGGSVVIKANGELGNIEGFGGLTLIGDELHVAQNPELTDMSGFAAVATIGGDLTVQTTSVATLGLSSLTSVGGVDINENHNLTSLNSLGGLTSIPGDLDLVDNDGLTTLNGLGQLTTVDGSVFIAGNDSLVSLVGLSSLSEIGESLGVADNYNLVALNGIGQLVSVPSAYVGSNPVCRQAHSDNEGRWLRDGIDVIA